MPKATATGLDANERSFNAVSESHQFFSFISFKSKVINETGERRFMIKVVFANTKTNTYILKSKS